MFGLVGLQVGHAANAGGLFLSHEGLPPEFFEHLKLGLLDILKASLNFLSAHGPIRGHFISIYFNQLLSVYDLLMNFTFI